MNILKKLTAVILTVVMMLTIAPLSGIVLQATAATDSGTFFRTLTWTVDTETGVLNIKGTGEMGDEIIYGWGDPRNTPWYPYREIIKTVNISGGVTSIGNRAFMNYFPKITSVTIGDSVEAIGKYAFYNCTGLKSVTFGKSVESIGIQAFEGCTALVNITLPDSLIKMGGNVFGNCDSITSVKFPASLLETNGDFHDCDKLTSIIVDKNNPKYSSDENGVLFDKNKTMLILFPKGNPQKSYTIPNSVTTIWEPAFHYGCNNLTSITIPTSVTQINKDAFKGFNTLTDVYYCGSKSQWNQIEIGSNNENLTNATIHYSHSEKSDLSKETTKLSSLVNTVNGPKLTWNSVRGASGYYVYRRTSGKSWTRICITTAINFIDTSAKSGTTYIYTAKAYNSISASKYESGLTLKCLTSPTISSVSNTTAGANIKWGAVTGASRYYIYRKTADGTYKNIGNTTSTNYTDKTAPSGTKYYYIVRAGYGTTLSSYRAGKGLIYLTAPTVSSVTNTTTGVKVAWGAVTGASGYYVYRKTANGTYTKIGSTSGTNFTDTSAKSGTTYQYTVRAYSGSTMSSYRSGVGIKYLVSPKVSSVTNTTAGAKVTWGKTTGATGYFVYRKTATGSYARVGTTKSTSFTDKTAKKGTTYYYTVRAYYGSTLSSYRAGTKLVRK